MKPECPEGPEWDPPQQETNSGSSGRNAKATKADDAAVPEYLWDRNLTPVLDLTITKALIVLRGFTLCWWTCYIEAEIFVWFRKQPLKAEISKFLYNDDSCKQQPRTLCDWLAGMDCLNCSRHSEWWDWADGSRPSRPFYWRWPENVEKSFAKVYQFGS